MYINVSDTYGLTERLLVAGRIVHLLAGVWLRDFFVSLRWTSHYIILTVDCSSRIRGLQGILRKF